MKIEDCEVGMRVKDKQNTEYTIVKIKNNRLKLKGYNLLYQPEIFDPVNKFKVGDEVSFTGKYGKYKATVWGIKKNKYAVSYINQNNFEQNIVVKENRLSPLKKKDELEKGDKFINIDNDTIKVLKKYKDDYDIKYVGYTFIGDLKYIGLWTTGEIQEIIYD